MADSTKIFLLRHGETLWNTEQRLQGHKNSDLTEVGREQARQNGLALKRFGADSFRLISSPLGRCRETANIIAEALEFDSSNIEYEDRVKEISFGSWEGQQIHDIQEMDSEAFNLRKANRWDVPAPGGESYSMVAERLNEWLKDIEGQSLILVSHGCAGRILRGIYAQIQKELIYSLDESHDAIYLLEHGEVTRIA